METLRDLETLVRFVEGKDPRVRVNRINTALAEVILPDDSGALVLEWEPGGAVKISMPIVRASEDQRGAVTELIAEVNAGLGVLGFVLYPDSGWVEYRLSVFPDERGEISAVVAARAIVTVQESVIAIAPRLEEACRREMPVIPTWWSQD